MKITQEHPDLVDFFRKIYLPKEMMIQTILVNSGRFNLCDDNKRFICWNSGYHGHPAGLT